MPALSGVPFRVLMPKICAARLFNVQMSVAAFLISMVVYFLLGFMGAMAFDNVQRLISMNWASYTGVCVCVCVYGT